MILSFLLDVKWATMALNVKRLLGCRADPDSLSPGLSDSRG
jgi:hypothetical protein